MSELEMKIASIANVILADSPAEVEKSKAKLVSLMTTSSSKGYAPSSKKVEDHICDLLLDVGVPDHLLGHRYISDAIKRIIANPDLLQELVSGLYHNIAKDHNTTPSRVERAMRHAVEVAFDRGDFDVLNKYFGNTISCTRGKPTCGEFLARMANVIRSRVREEA